MELSNQTPYPAHLFRSRIEGNRFAASVLLRVTFDLGVAPPVPSPEQPWLASRAPWKSPHGEMESDDVFARDGCDVFVFGSARPRAGEPLSTLEVRIAIGGFSRTVRVSGDRTWVEREGRLVPGEPAPIESVPLIMARAFGGKAEWDGLEVPFPDNPLGCGFYLEEELATGGSLPNIEDPEHLMTRWDDRPEPAGLGFCPRTFSGRARRGVLFNDQGELLEIRGALYNAAFPGMIAERVEPGQPVRIEGMRAGGPLVFELPDLPVFARLRFGDTAHDQRMAIDQVGIDVERNQLFVAYRFAFRYEITEGKPRGCSVYVKEHVRDDR